MEKREKALSAGSKIFLLFLGLIIVGFSGFSVIGKTLTGLIFVHIGAIGIFGIVGCLAGFLAKRKGYSFWKVFSIGFFLPIIVGIIATFFSRKKDGFFICGGTESLLVCFSVMFVFLIFFLLAKQKRNLGDGQKGFGAGA